eukprot:SAG22_NODE_2410_length_2603_cov_3.860623_1_plen_296_part_10
MGAGRDEAMEFLMEEGCTEKESSDILAILASGGYTEDDWADEVMQLNPDDLKVMAEQATAAALLMSSGSDESDDDDEEDDEEEAEAGDLPPPPAQGGPGTPPPAAGNKLKSTQPVKPQTLAKQPGAQLPPPPPPPGVVQGRHRRRRPLRHDDMKRSPAEDAVASVPKLTLPQIGGTAQPSDAATAAAAAAPGGGGGRIEPLPPSTSKPSQAFGGGSGRLALGSVEGIGVGASADASAAAPASGRSDADSMLDGLGLAPSVTNIFRRPRGGESRVRREELASRHFEPKSGSMTARAR